MSQTLVAQASQPAASLAPAVHSLCAHDEVPSHDVSPQTLSTSLTHTGPHWFVQHEGLTAQIMVTHASHPEVSATPCTQSLCAHAAPPLLELDELDEEDEEDELDDEVEEDEAADELDDDVTLEDGPSGEPPAPLDAEAVTSPLELDAGPPPAPPALEDEDVPMVLPAPPAPPSSPEVRTVPSAQLEARATAKASAAKVR